jgi:hypothetical protein
MNPLIEQLATSPPVLQRLGEQAQVAQQALRLAQAFQQSKGRLNSLPSRPLPPPGEPPSLPIDETGLFSAQQLIKGLGDQILNKTLNQTLSPSLPPQQLTVSSLLHR